MSAIKAMAAEIVNAVSARMRNPIEPTLIGGAVEEVMRILVKRETQLSFTEGMQVMPVDVAEATGELGTELARVRKEMEHRNRQDETMKGVLSRFGIVAHDGPFVHRA